MKKIVNCKNIADVADQLNLRYSVILNNIQNKRMLKKEERSGIYFFYIIGLLFNMYGYNLGYGRGQLGYGLFKCDLIRDYRRSNENNLLKLEQETEKNKFFSVSKNPKYIQLDLFKEGVQLDLFIKDVQLSLFDKQN